MALRAPRAEHIFMAIYRHIQHRRSGFSASVSFRCARNRKSGLGAFEVTVQDFCKIKETSARLGQGRGGVGGFSVYLVDGMPSERLCHEIKAKG